MEKHFAELIEIMEKEAKIYKELKEVEESKKRIIIDNDVKALEAITKKEQGFVKTIVNLESLRAQVIDGFCNSKGIQNVDNVDEIILHLNSEERNLMVDKKNELVNTVNELMEVNHLNGKLLEQSIEYINYSMEIVKSVTEADAGYAEDAKDRTVKVDRNIFDAKI